MRSLIAHAIALVRSQRRLEEFAKAVAASARVVDLRRKEATEASNAKANALRHLEAVKALHAVSLAGKPPTAPPTILCERIAAYILASRAAAAAEARFVASTTVHASLPPIVALARADFRALQTLVSEEAAGVVTRASRARANACRRSSVGGGSRLRADAAPFFAGPGAGADKDEDAGMAAAAAERRVADVIAKALACAWGAVAVAVA